MIEFRGVSTQRGKLAAATIDATWGAGAHAILAATPDSGRTLLALASGALGPQRGTVHVLGGAATDVNVRKQVARVPSEAVLPERLRVDEVLAMAAAIRGDPAQSAATRLAAWGFERLARRRVSSLSRAEARGVALAEAFTSARVRVVLLEEPFVAVDAETCARLAEAIRAKAKDGGAVLFSTGSLRDATTFGGDVTVVAPDGSTRRLAPAEAPFEGGKALASERDEPRDGSPAPPARVTVITANADDVQRLVSHLVREVGVAGLAYGKATSAQPVVLYVDGTDVIALADAAARAAVAARVDVLQLHAVTHANAELV